MIYLIVVIVAACLFGLITYHYRTTGQGRTRQLSVHAPTGGRGALRTQQRVVFVFEVVLAAVILIQSDASWPVKIAVFVVLQVVTLGFLAGLHSFYEND